jgi:hypothetical protein
VLDTVGNPSTPTVALRHFVGGSFVATGGHNVSRSRPAGSRSSGRTWRLPESELAEGFGERLATRTPRRRKFSASAPPFRRDRRAGAAG